MLSCNCIKNEVYPLEEKCKANYITFKCITSATCFPKKVFLGNAKEEFKKGFHNHLTSFKNKPKMSHTTLAKYIWYLKDKRNVMNTSKWYILKSVPPYSNITKNCRSVDYASKTDLISSPIHPDKLLKISELGSKCGHIYI